MSETRKKIALVTGGARGIGRATVMKLAQSGYDVAFTYRSNPDAAAEVAEELRRLGSHTNYYRADNARLDEALAAFGAFRQDYGHIDLLVNNAGVTISRSFLEETPERYDYCMNVDLKAPYFMAQQAAKLMIAEKNPGVIVNVTSNQGGSVFPGSSVYGTAKAALAKLTRHMALELAPYGIRALAVAPGYCNVWDAKGNTPGEKIILNDIPLGTYGTPQQIAALVTFLASEDAAYMTGIEVLSDGGTALPVSTCVLDYPVEKRKDKIELLWRHANENYRD